MTSHLLHFFSGDDIRDIVRAIQTVYRVVFDDGDTYPLSSASYLFHIPSSVVRVVDGVTFVIQGRKGLRAQFAHAGLSPAMIADARNILRDVSDSTYIALFGDSRCVRWDLPMYPVFVDDCGRSYSFADGWHGYWRNDESDSILALFAWLPSSVSRLATVAGQSIALPEYGERLILRAPTDRYIHVPSRLSVTIVAIQEVSRSSMSTAVVLVQYIDISNHDTAHTS